MATTTRTTTRGEVAGFSSQGLAFDGSVKPDVAAPGVGARDVRARHGRRRLAALRRGQRHERRGGDGRGRRRAARADAARARRPGAPQPARRVRAARPARRRSRSGAGSSGSARRRSVRSRRRPRRSASGSGAARAGMRRARSSCGTSRRGGSQLSLSAVVDGESEALQFTVVPSQLHRSRIGRSRKVHVTVTARRPRRASARHGRRSQVAPSGSRRRCACRGRSASGATRRTCSPHVSLSETSFAPSDTSPALLDDPGRQSRPGRRPADPARLAARRAALHSRRPVRRRARAAPQPPARARTASGSPAAARRARVLPPGGYELRLAAWPTLPRDAAPSRAQVRFQIE